jgi:hypothetical protein
MKLTGQQASRSPSLIAHELGEPSVTAEYVILTDTGEATEA